MYVHKHTKINKPIHRKGNNLLIKLIIHTCIIKMEFDGNRYTPDKLEALTLYAQILHACMEGEHHGA